MSINRENPEMAAGWLYDDKAGATAEENYEVQSERKRKEDALIYLTESGRAGNREDAERYLAKSDRDQREAHRSSA
jgi:hypothetical protein